MINNWSHEILRIKNTIRSSQDQKHRTLDANCWNDEWTLLPNRYRRLFQPEKKKKKKMETKTKISKIIIKGNKQMGLMQCCRKFKWCTTNYWNKFWSFSVHSKCILNVLHWMRSFKSKTFWTHAIFAIVGIGQKPLTKTTQLNRPLTMFTVLTFQS